jgi:hypothetical protein
MSLAIFVVLLVSEIFHRLIERPSIQIGQILEAGGVSKLLKL